MSLHSNLAFRNLQCRNKLKKDSLTKNCFSQSLEQFFLTVGQNNFGNKTPFLNDGLRNESRIILPIGPHFPIVSKNPVIELRRGFQKKDKQTGY